MAVALLVAPAAALALTSRARLEARWYAWQLVSSEPSVRAAARERLVAMDRAVTEAVWPDVVASCIVDALRERGPGASCLVAVGQRPDRNLRPGPAGMVILTDERQPAGTLIDHAALTADGRTAVFALERVIFAPTLKEGGWNSATIRTWRIRRAPEPLDDPLAQRAIIVIVASPGSSPATCLTISTGDETMAPRVIERVAATLATNR